MNPLKLIGDFVNWYTQNEISEVLGHFSHRELRDWVTIHTNVDEVEIDLAVDVLIAAGIGEAAEQMATVYSSAHWLNDDGMHCVTTKDLLGA